MCPECRVPAGTPRRRPHLPATRHAHGRLDTLPTVPSTRCTLSPGLPFPSPAVPTPLPPPPAPPAPDASADAKPKADDDGGAEEEEAECGFCVFMKGGGCKAAFEAWSACVDGAREGGADFADACRDATLALQACMERNPSYYGDFILPKEEGEGEGGEGQDTAGVTAEEEAAVLVAAADEAGHHGKGEGGGR